MKRFQSSFLRIQRICQQQLRIAERNFAKAQTAVRQVDEQLDRLRQEQTEFEQAFADQLTVSSGLSSGALRTARARVDHNRSDVLDARRRRMQLEQDEAQARSVYRQLKARCDGLDEFVRKKRDEHRHEALHNEQMELEESARTHRTVSACNDSNTLRRDVPPKTEDGVIQR